MTNSTPPLFDADKVARAISLLVPPGQVTELRVLDAKLAGDQWRTGNATGYFDDQAAVLAALKTIMVAKGIYFIPNPVDPALLARASNRLRPAGKGESTADGNIVRRQWLLIDCDAKRPSGISANDAEHAAAIERVKAIAAHLSELGWPVPIVADSGNGCHALYRIDLPTDDGGLVQRCLAALAARFDDVAVTVDRSVFNPSRIWKLYGTRACKGDSTIERPWRMSKILSSPTELAVVPSELFESLAGPAAVDARTAMASWAMPAGFDLDGFIARHLPDAKGPTAWKGNGRIWELPQSPLCDHHDGQCFVGQQPGGAILAGCHHNSCQGRWGWAELRERFEPREQRTENTTVDISGIVAGANRSGASAHRIDDDDVQLDAGPADPGPFPANLLAVEGFLKDAIAWNLECAHKAQPVLALGGGLCLLSVLTGRKITDELGTRTNLYCLGIGESGCGKDRARVVNKQILHQAGLEKMIGNESIASESGIISAVEEQPAILFQLDEIGRVLKTLGNAVKAPHLYGVATVLMRMFTSSGDLFIGAAYADAKKRKTIKQPHAVLYGTTVPDSLYQGFTTESLTDGFLSRMLIFEADDATKRTFTVKQPPQSIIDEARWWGEFNPGGNLASENPQPRVVPMTHDARAAMSDFDELTDASAKRLGKPLGPLWTRATEKARKLALLRACSKDRQSPMIDGTAARWAIDLVDYLTRRLIFTAHYWIAENPYDDKRKKVFRAIDGCGKSGATRSDLAKGVKMAVKERDECIDSLREAGEIIVVKQPTATKTRTVYLSARFYSPAVAV